VAWTERGPGDWNAQLRKGVLELCILGLIARAPRYGYDIVQELASAAPLSTTEGTIYPLLRRLKQTGWLEATWEPSESGPPRQYYRLTPSGRKTLATMRENWRSLASAVNPYLRGEVSKSA
jgi:PadR family transcriptional regulator PadR